MAMHASTPVSTQRADAINFHELIAALRRNIALVAVVLVAGTLISALLTPAAVSQYKSVAVVLVKEPTGALDSVTLSRSLATTRSTLRKTVELAGVNVNIEPRSVLRTLPDEFEVRHEGQQLVMFQVIGSNPSDPTKLANAWAAVVIEQLNLQAGSIISRLRAANDKVIAQVRDEWNTKLEALKKSGAIRIKESGEMDALDFATAELSGLAHEYRDASKLRVQLNASSLGDGTFGQVIAPAVDAQLPFTVTNPARYFIAGILASLLLGAGLAIARELTTDAVRGARDLPPLGDSAVRDVIPSVPIAGYDLVLQNPQSPAAEALKRLSLTLSGIFRGAENTRQIFAVTSSSDGDGKSFVAANLAAAFASQGRSTLLIDGSSRRGALTAWARVPAGRTLQSALAANSWSAADAAAHGNYAFLPADPASTVSNAQNSTSLAAFFRKVRETHHVVVIDCGPIPSNSDAAAFCQAADMTLLVARSRRTRPQELERALEMVRSLGATRVGVVVNALDAHDLRADGLKA